MRPDQTKLLMCLADPCEIMRCADLEPERFQRAILHSRDRTLLIAASRRSGKTTAMSAYALWLSLIRKGNVIVMAPRLENAQIIIGYINDFISTLPLKPQILRQNQTQIEFGNGSKVLAVPLGESGEGFTGARGWGGTVLLDETSYLPKSVIQQSVLPVLAGDNRNRLIAASTPADMGQSNWFYSTAMSGRCRFIRAGYEEIEHFDKDYVESLRAGMTQDAWDREFSALFVESDSASFRLKDLQNLHSETAGILI